MREADKPLKEKEASELCGVCVSYLRNARCYGGDGPPYIKIGRAVRYLASDIEAWLHQHRVCSTGAEKQV